MGAATPDLKNLFTTEVTENTEKILNRRYSGSFKRGVFHHGVTESTEKGCTFDNKQFLWAR